MLQTLSIKNLALFKEESIDFSNGLNILLGETGSGKSLIFDAILFVLGQKTDKTLLRTGEKQMRVDALFTNLSNASLELLKEFDFDDCEEILLTRTLSDDGKTSYKLNGIPVVLSMVKALSKTLLDSLVQHESIDLLKSKNHLAMLDKFGGSQIANLKANINELITQRRQIEKEIKSLGGSDAERERLKDILSYQINEIEQANLEIGEDDDIKNKLDLLSNAEKVYDIVELTEKNLTRDTYSALNQINEVIDSLASLYKIDVINECHDRLVSLRYDLEDINDSITSLKNSVNYDEIEFNHLDSRLDLIKSLKKKYGGDISFILKTCEDLKQKMDCLESSEENIEKLNKNLIKIETNLLDLANCLTNKRKEIALIIENRVTKELCDLGMKNNNFKVIFQKKEISVDGQDDIEFIFSANKGQDMKNLAKTASGGETSRLMLALKNIFASIDGVGTLIFDEVDSGISGEIGNMVAEKLRSISTVTQVLCITHLPQVAALSDCFYLVQKKIISDQTFSSVNLLDERNGVIEIARMISGDNITDIAVKHALELRLRK